MFDQKYNLRGVLSKFCLSVTHGNRQLDFSFFAGLTPPLLTQRDSNSDDNTDDDDGDVGNTLAVVWEEDTARGEDR